MRRLRWDIISVCVAAAVTIGMSAAQVPAVVPSGEAAVMIQNGPAAQFTPSDLRGSFPELPPKRSTPRTPRRGPSMRFAAMDLLASGG
jgi:hypothetical protein